MASRPSLTALLRQSCLATKAAVAAPGGLICPSRLFPSSILRNNSQSQQHQHHRVRFLASSSLSSCSPQKRRDHCATCTCPEEEDDDIFDEQHYQLQQRPSSVQQHPVLPSPSPSFCGRPMEADPPLSEMQEPKFSFFRRVLDTHLLTPLSTSAQGRQYLLDALQQHTAAAYWQLTEHGVHQSDPAYCGITTLLVVLNSMCIDPNVRWRGGWRYFGNEDTLLQLCCLSPARIRNIGIDLEEFSQLATCHGLQVQCKRPINNEHNTNHDNDNRNGHSLEEFRADVQRLLTEPSDNNHDDKERDWGEASSVVVVSFARSVLGQTGEGHFSPLAAYHAATDQVLVLDVARFKYAPYWVPVELLYQAMIPHDARTQQSRGWFLLHPPPAISTTSSSYGSLPSYQGRNITNEASRPAHLVPKVRVNQTNDDYDDDGNDFVQLLPQKGDLSCQQGQEQ